MADDRAAIARAAEALGDLEAAHAWERRARPHVDRLLPAGSARARALRGEWLGHSLHPLLTDLPIGFWTSAWALDLVGGRRSRPAAQRLVGLGVLSAVPTAWAGWADWPTHGPRARRVGVVHAASNLAATTLYAGSWVARRRGAHGTGVALGHVGAAVATLGGYLGGHLEAGAVAEHDEA